ncbi:LppU/SCO3897 family protein [Streptomyces alanosinicus]|uniref:Uncharacterized protein n=1 Tax=Streptomyces alanosinicus TaxID=68171 RepID=A0A918YPN6_9ACTN|nr:hypothetical protein [Streptomyces alanosinicus]GHE11788.1 hypothetical protein GCM10010339_72810 [Streptomyces alanosinicus]
MSSPENPENSAIPEIPISLTAREAAAGTTIRLPDSSGLPPIHIPPVRDGDTVPVRLGGRDVLLRIRVVDGPAAAPTPAPAPGQGQGRGQGGRVLAVLAVLALVVVIVTAVVKSAHTAGGGSSSGSYAEDSPSYSPTATGAPYSSDPYPSDTYSSDPYPSDTYSSDPYSSPTPEPSPYTSGTCLNGTLPDSTTAQSVSGVDEVSCSASDAHYKVIETIPLTSDMSRCNDNSQTQYAFSSRYTINGSTINEYVYCLVGLGSYAR